MLLLDPQNNPGRKWGFQLKRMSQNNSHLTSFQLKAHRYFQLLALSVLPCVSLLWPVCFLPIFAHRCLFFWNASVPPPLFLLAVGDPSECRGPVSSGSFITGPDTVVTTSL